MPSRSKVAALPDLTSRSGLAYLSMLENAPFGICIVDKDFRLALISQGARKVFSVVPDALGRDFEEVLRAIWPEPFVSEVLGRFRHTLATGESYHAPGTVEQRAGNGPTEAYDWKLDRVLLPDGGPGVICYFHDLTGRDQGQLQLRETEVNKSFLLELSDALRPLADPAQLEGTACALMARHLGVDRAYFVWVDEAAGTARIIKDHVREGAVSLKGDHRTADFQWSIGVMRDGTCHVVADSQDATIVPAKDRAAYAALDIRSFIGGPLIKEGALVGVLCITDRRVRTWQPDEASLVREVGERIWAAVEWARADQARREGELRLQRMMNVPSVGMLNFDEQGNLVAANDAFLHMLGYSRAEFDARAFTWRDLTPPEHVAISERIMHDILTTGRGGPYDKEYYHKDGTRRWFTFAAADLGDGTIVEYAFDISARKAAEAGLRRSHERYQAFMHNSSEGIYRCELDRVMPVDLPVDDMLDFAYEHGYIAECNDAMARMYGYESGRELEGARLADVTPRTPENEAFLKAFFEAGFKLEGGISQEQHRDGHTIHIRNNLFGFVEGGHLVRVWGTQTDITERMRTEKALVDSAERFRIATDTGRVGIWEWHIPTDHVTWNDILYDVQGVKKEEFGGTVKDFTALVHPDDRERVGETIRQSLESDVPYEVSFRAVRPNDGRVIWLHSNGRVLRDADGKPERLLGAVVDMTGAKEAEALLLEGDRRKDEFLATLAHELRNPLAPLRNGLEVLDVAFDQPDAIKEVGAMMRRQVDQMVHLVNDLLDLSRISRGVIELREQAVDLHTALQQAVETARPMVEGNQQRLLLEFSPAALIVNGDPTRLAQIFGNLLDNAGKYTDKGGTITVRSYVQGDQAVIEVMDTGIGLSMDQLPRVFDMFSQVDRSYHRARGGLGIGFIS